MCLTFIPTYRTLFYILCRFRALYLRISCLGHSSVKRDERMEEVVLVTKHAVLRLDLIHPGVGSPSSNYKIVFMSIFCENRHIQITFQATTGSHVIPVRIVRVHIDSLRSINFLKKSSRGEWERFREVGSFLFKGDSYIM